MDMMIVLLFWGIYIAVKILSNVAEELPHWPQAYKLCEFVISVRVKRVTPLPSLHKSRPLTAEPRP